MLELLARRAADAEPGFATKQVRWAVVFDGQGTFLDVVELGEAGQRGNRGQTFRCCPEFSRQYKQGGGKSEFLWDAASVVARYTDDPDDERLKARHGHFIKLLEEAAKVMSELGPAAQVLADAQVLGRIRARLKEKRARPTDKVTLQVSGRFPLESEDWHVWWRKTYQASAGLDEDDSAVKKPHGGRKMVCLATGSIVEPLDTHPKIEGLAGVGGQGMGDVLVGMDKDAFTSYFLEQSANAAVSREAAYRYRAALNELIRTNSRKLAGALVLHWFKEKVDAAEDPLSWLDEPPEVEERNAQQAARELLDSIAQGRRSDLGNNRYYALTLSGMSGRVMVRDWMEGPFEELVANIGHWFDDLSIVHRDGGRTASDPKFNAVMGATVRELSYDPPSPPAPFVAKMWRVAVRGEPIPQTALAQALARAKVDIIGDEPFSHARMGLMKAYHIRSSREDGEYMKPYLNEEHPAPAYHCGRMMAVLAKLQQAALGNVGAGVVQRYYAAASTTPALVLGRLVRGGQFHLNKLEPGLAHWYEEKLGSIAAQLGDSVPQTLTLEEQSLFALGYYQQLAFRKSDDADAEEKTNE